jgi:hypothetical protein
MTVGLLPRRRLRVLASVECRRLSQPSITVPPQLGCPAGDPGVGLLPGAGQSFARSLGSPEFSEFATVM